MGPKRNHNKEPLVGQELLNKIDELGDIKKIELVRECGYSFTKDDGTESFNFFAFSQALLEAKAETIRPEKISSINLENRSYKKNKSGRQNALFPDHKKAAEILFMSGEIKHENQEYKEAIEDYTKAIEYDPEYLDAYEERGNAKESLGKYQEAILDYNRAIQINANDNTYNYRAISRILLNEIKPALRDLNKALKINAKNVDSYVIRGYAKYLSNDLKGACKDWEKAAELGDQDAAELLKKHLNDRFK